MRKSLDGLRVRLVRGAVSTDDILPARYKHSTVDPAEMAPHVFENLLPAFAASVRPGDVLMSDSFFGIGSSREQAVSSMRALGIVAVVAPAFGRIFHRNAWNLALPAIEVEEALPFTEGATIRIDLPRGLMEGEGGTFTFRPVPGILLAIMEAGGLLGFLREHCVS